MLLTDPSFSPIRWMDDGGIKLLDQRQLPQQLSYLYLDSCQEVTQAIMDMAVRGAPAIGITAAYAVVLAVRAAYARDKNHWQHELEDDLTQLAAARPTAVNLHWAITQMRRHIATLTEAPERPLLAAAKAMHQADVAANQRMGQLGANCLSARGSVLTHCNAGALATGGYGTALGVIQAAFLDGLIDMVYVSETRPWLQGARLTAWELQQQQIPCTVIADSASAMLMQQKQIHWLIVGADRITSNGDVVNKIGTCTHAINARYHGTQVMVVAPTSSIDLQLATGQDVTIEERDGQEITHWQGHTIAPTMTAAWNPVFDITPAALVTMLVTEKGVIADPNQQKLAAMLDGCASPDYVQPLDRQR